MKIQEIPETALRGAVSIVTLPVNLARQAADRVRGQDSAPTAKAPVTPTAAETPAVVAEETDGLSAARAASKK
jgi:hypothetical protein